MYGIEAITAHNGWAQAITGAIIVMSGLAVLATVISLLPKLVGLFEGNPSPSSVPSPSVQPETEAKTVDIEISNINIFTDIKNAAQNYSPVIESLGETFELSALYQIFKDKNYPHPHLTIKAFREAGILLPSGDGTFVWKLGSE